MPRELPCESLLRELHEHDLKAGGADRADFAAAFDPDDIGVTVLRPA